MKYKTTHDLYFMLCILVLYIPCFKRVPVLYFAIQVFFF